MGVRSVAVYSKEDAKSLHVQLADQRICIGEGPARGNYLNIDMVIQAALNMGCDAVHPGYGFLSENSEFARKCEENGLTFIGPSADVIDRMGNKSAARKTMMEAGVPVVPGTKEPVTDPAAALEEAEKIGFPVMIKASSGGGGKGMRAAFDEEEFTRMFSIAQHESANAFGDDTMYIEKLILHPRHVEVQIIADNEGNVVALGERDCSVQRNNQKLIEDLLSASDKIVATAESGLFGFISMFSFIWIVIWLMLTVCRVFNNVWKAEERRSFFHVLGIVLGVIILSPFVIVLFFSGSVVYSTVLDYIVPSDLFFSEHLKSFLSWVLFAGASILILTAMYKLIPAAKVHLKHAFKAAAIAGIGFTAVQYLYLETQVMVAKQSAVYGVLAALPLFMIWLNIGWTIVLYGAELSYSFQHVNHLNLKEIL